MIPELIGRLPVICSLRPLDEAALVRILTEPKNALVKQYQALFAMENAELEFTDGALRLIARKAHEKDTGARGLRSIIEEVMLDIMYELPEQPAGSTFVVTEDVVAGRQPLFAVQEERVEGAASRHSDMLSPAGFGAKIAPKGPPFTQPRATPWGCGAPSAHESNRPNGPIVPARERLARWADCRYCTYGLVPRALPWAGRTAGPSARVTSNTSLISLP